MISHTKMNQIRQFKTKLQVNYTYLIDTLNIEPIKDLCFEKSVLTFTDLERLTAERSRPDKVKLFLNILKSKSELKSYETFLQVLEDERVKQPFVKTKLNETEVNEDHKEELEQSRLLEQIIGECIVAKEKSALPIEDLLKAVKYHFHRHHRCMEVTLPEVCDMVTKVFPNVSRVRNRRKNITALENCSLKQEASWLEDIPEDLEGAVKPSEAIPLEDITPDRVAVVMKVFLEQFQLDASLSDKFEEQDIDGQALAELNEDLVEKLFPQLTMGKRLKVLKAKNEALEELKKPPELLLQEKPAASVKRMETYRAFDSRPRPVDVYESGYVLPDEQSRPGNLLQPLHKYRLIVGTGSMEQNIAQEAVQFAAACLNERANGTIHFGVVGKYDSVKSSSRRRVPGEVVGLHVDRQSCEFAITAEIYRAFFPDQREVAVKCIRDPVFMPVVGKDADGRELSVVEVDVVPHSILVATEAFFLNPVTGKHSLLYRYLDGSAVKAEGQECQEFMKVRKQLTLQRKDSERTFRPQQELKTPLLNRKLHNLITGEHEYEVMDIYPILFLGPIQRDMTNDFLEENFSFIKSLEPLAVFDFDPTTQDGDGQLRGLYSVMESQLGQVYKALTTDNFDKESEENRNCGSKEGVSKLLESIESSSFRCWIFCNGYMPLGKQELQATAWRSRRGEGFKEAVRFYKEKIPSDKACIVILLMSRNYDVLLGALEEIFTKFPNQWILLAETEQIAQDLMAEVVRRSYVDKTVLEERAVIGMPWSHVNQSIRNICGFIPSTGCMLPSTTGTLCLMKEREKNELSDLEIVSSSQCEDDHVVRRGNQKALAKKKNKVEIDFYRGKRVSWWNFYFDDHVLKRAQFVDLMTEVRKSLDGQIPEDEKVAVITLLHQRGAGGSTMARQIIWELRKTVRCCVIKQITDQTCDQITRFRNFEEHTSPRPPLVLIDNKDEEKVFQLCSNLNEKARREARDRGAQVFCVLIICVRMAEFPKKRDKSKVMLGHGLPPNEIQWFRTKYERLEEKYNQKQLSLHPKLLISFNILKENFNPEYIKHAVEEFVSKITQVREQRLLKYIALINSFDPDFQSVPMSCFNPIMCTQPKLRPRLGQKTFCKGDVHWEAALSQSINVLLNRTSDLCLGGGVMAVRIINTNLSVEILRYLCQQDGSTVTISDVMLEFLHSDIFKPSNESTVQSKLVKIIKDILKKRVAYKKGRAKFSPIILEIGKVEGYEEAARVLKVGFEKFDDPMIAQQIARIYIHCQNWEFADKYAQIAQNMKPKSSYLCDTHGQVYKEKLIFILKECLENEILLQGEKAQNVIDMAQKAILIFRREQMLSDQDCGTGYNNCGFFSELRVVVTLLDCCRFLPAFKYDQGDRLHDFLVKKECIPAELLDDIGEERVAQLKTLYYDYERPMRRLEDEQIQLKEDSCYQYSPTYSNSIKDRLMFVHLQECLDTYFGEDSDEVPKSLNKEDACEFRRRRVRRRGGNSLRSIYGLRDDANAAKEYAGMHALIEQNINSEFCNAFDLKTVLSLTLARVSKSEDSALQLSLTRVLEWTLQLYEKTKQDTVPYLEAYLYLVMFHWPTKWRIEQKLPLCACNKIKDVIREWKAAFQSNHPAQNEEEGKKPTDRRRGTTLFFLGQGEGFREIVFYSELQAFHGGHKMGDSIWNTVEAQKRLQKLKGTLLQGGGEMAVTIHSTKGNATPLVIPTSFPIKDPSLWQKGVHFVLGFCWSGPKAFSVTKDDQTMDLQAASTPNFQEPRRHMDRREQQKLMSEVAVNQFWRLFYDNRTSREMVETDIRLNEKNPRKTGDLKSRKQKLEKERMELVEKRTSVLHGPDL